jgi:hypothetical protein
MSFQWNPKTKEYLDSRGKAIPPKQIRSYIEAARANGKAKIQQLAQSYVDGRISLSSFVTQARPLYVGAHSAAAQIGAGGRSQMTSKLNGRLGNLIKFQDKRFKTLWLSLEQGEISKESAVSRAGNFIESITGSYEAMRQGVMIDGGFKEALNVLGAERNCDECSSLSGQGFIPIEEMTPIGSRTCLFNCNCEIEFR